MTAKNLLRKIVLPALILISQIAYSQGKVVTGKVTDSKDGSGVGGVTVIAKGAKTGTQTGSDGSYQITVSPSVTILIFSSVGYGTKEVSIDGKSTLDVVLEITNTTLTEVVTVGYGTARRKDITGSVALVTAKDFNKGPATAPEQLIMGKVAGVQITTGGGAPGSGSRIRIRNGSSLNASNSPLIVIDGVPLDNNGISGTANPLSLINSNDIESINILKDASATAIYGNRASNGVIIIITKKGKAGKLHISFNSVVSQYRREDGVDVLNAEQFKALVTTHGDAAHIALLGSANTDWQGAIYKNAIGSDNNISFTGGLKNFFPYRLSLGYLNQDGILKTDNLQRTSAALNLSPKFLNNNLSVDVNVKFSVNKSTFANQGAIGAAVFFDPTHPIYAPSVNNVDLGGYYEWLNANGNGQPNTLAPRNPLSLLMQRSDKGTAKRSIGNIQFDYKLPWVPGLRANYNFGYDVSNSYGDVVVPATAASAYYVGGSKSHYSQEKSNVLSEFYLNYAKTLNAIKSRFDVQGGYTYQDWVRENPSYPTINGNGTIPASTPFKTQNTLVSFYGRGNFAYDDKYLVTATLRRDGSSRFTGDNQWGTFPSVALAWRLSREAFFFNSKVLSDLKLRFGWGITGQQDIGGDYDYLPRYTLSDSSSMYSFGNMYYFTYRPQGYDENLRWEQTTTWNGGLDFGFMNGRITGSVDYYFKKTKDLLANISVPAGSNLTNQITTNVGNMENKGVEVVLNGTPFKTHDFTWDAGFNFTYNEKTITNLSKVKDSTFIGYLVGGIAGGVGNTVQINTVGYSPNSFYVYKQVYNSSGLPVEGLYVDRNKSGTVTEADKYRYKSPEPRIYLGFNSQLTYKNLSLAFSMRASIDNYMYNNFKSNNGTYQNFAFPNYLGNVSSITPKIAFIGNDPNRYWSDYWIENASFLKMDYISLTYNLGSISKSVMMRLSATVQNAFTVTKYTGLDPEIAGGIDNNFYPRPRVFSLGVNLDFQK